MWGFSKHLACVNLLILQQHHEQVSFLSPFYRWELGSIECFCNFPRADRELSSLVERAVKKTGFFASPLARDREGEPPGMGGEQPCHIRLESPHDQEVVERWGCPPSSPGLQVFSSPFRALSHLCSGTAVARLSHSFLQLPSDLSGAKVWPQSAGAGRPASQGAHRALSPSFFSLLERQEPRRNPPGGRTERVKTPADKLARLRSLFSDQVRFPSALWRRFRTRPAPRVPPRGQGSPGSAWRLRRGFPSAAFSPGARPTSDFGDRSPRRGFRAGPQV